MQYLTYEAFIEQGKGRDHWSPDTGHLDRRWEYIARVISIIKSIAPASILELGTNGIQLTDISHTMDIHPERYANLTYRMDATSVPWGG